jgi:hypothetical protein
MHRSARDTRKAIDAFIAKKAEIDAMLARISKLSEDHFGADPDKVHWAMSETSRTMPDTSGASPTPPSGRGEHAE